MSFGVMYGAIYKLQYIKILDKKKCDLRAIRITLLH